jgi:DDE superfamily endonuclease
MKERRPALLPSLLVESFASLLLAFQSCFTQPSFCSFAGLVCAWILCSGRRSLTRVIQSAQLSQFKHYCSFHRFFSKARWNLDELGRCLFPWLLPFCSPVLVAAVDDTLARKSGRHIWGADMHHDPLRSTRVRPFFCFAHNWVVLSLQVSFPFAPHRHWAIPLLVRMYRKRKKNRLAPGRRGKWERKQTGQANPKEYRTRPQLALEMIQILAGWVPDRTIHVTGDSEYCGRAISRHLPDHVHLISRMTMKAALYERPPQHSGGRGRRRKKGKRLPSPLEMAENKKWSWTKTALPLYGKRVRVWYKTVDALWYSSAGQRLLRIVVVRDPSHRRRDDCFFSTDIDLTPSEILTTFSLRWPLEVCFRDVKQFLGFEDPQNRVSRATKRTAPLIFYIYDLVVIWYAQSGYKLASHSVLQRLWYKQKRSTSFEDLLRTLRTATWRERIFEDPALDAHTRKILQPLVEWAKVVA